MSNQYEFLTRWRVEGTCGEVADILGDPLALPRWWPSGTSAWRSCGRPTRAGSAAARACTHKRLPAVHAHLGVRGHRDALSAGFTLVATGDFDGRGVWTFEQDGPFVDITYDWRLSAEKPLLRNLSFLLKPVFEANHRWAMAQGEQSLKLELARRRATSDAARARVPPPPGPVTYAGAALVGGAVVVGAGLAYLMLRSRRRSG